MHRDCTKGPNRKQKLEGWLHCAESSPAVLEGLVNTVGFHGSFGAETMAEDQRQTHVKLP